jgi:iron complex outermembrane recepter protein
MRALSSSISALALATACMFASPAFAQATADPSPTPADPALQPAVDQTQAGVGEIIVTAQRRSENLQDVPVSVGTIDNRQLAAINTGGADIRGLSGRVPSLNIESSFGRTFPRFYIRGLGNTDFDLNASQPVSLVYDDVVLENPILKGFPAFDLDRIEVLRGPQGTLFGRNTPAGIVKFDTVRPGHGRNYARISYGSYSTINAEGGVGAQLDDGVSFRLSGLWQHRNDWIDNIADPGKHDLEGYNDVALRGQFQLAPTDAVKIRLVGQYRNLDGNARIFRANAIQQGTNKLIGLDGGDFKRNKVATDGLNFQELTTANLAGTVEYDFGPATLYSVTAYWHGKLKSRGDIDGGFGCSFCGPGFTNNSLPGFIPFAAQSQDNVPSLDQFTQEIRVASNAKAQGLGYQAGLFYFDENLKIESFDFGSPTDPTPDAIVNQHQNAHALGIFGSVNYKFTQGLTLQAGARWNHDKKKLVADRLFDIRPLFVGGGPVPQTTTRVHDSQLTWDASALQELMPDINVYARVAKGYRAPAIQGRILFDRDVTTAKSERTMSYEAGFKTLLFDRRLRFNVDVYYFKTKDLQLSAVGGGTNANLLLNADAVKGHGIEAELEARPARGMTMTAGLSYNIARIHDNNLTVETCGAPCTVLDPIAVPAAPFQPAIVFIDGNQLPQAPKWTLNFTAGYEFPVGPGNIYAYTDWYYRSKIQFFLYRSVEFSDDSEVQGGLRIGYRTDRYDIAGFVRNITNDESAVSGIDFNNLTAMVNEPRIFGVEAGVKF